MKILNLTATSCALAFALGLSGAHAQSSGSISYVGPCDASTEAASSGNAARCRLPDGTVISRAEFDARTAANEFGGDDLGWVRDRPDRNSLGGGEPGWGVSNAQAESEADNFGGEDPGWARNRPDRNELGGGEPGWGVETQRNELGGGDPGWDVRGADPEADSQSEAETETVPSLRRARPSRNPDSTARTCEQNARSNGRRDC